MPQGGVSNAGQSTMLSGMPWELSALRPWGSLGNNALDAARGIPSDNLVICSPASPHTTLIPLAFWSMENMYPLPRRMSGGWAILLHSNLTLLCWQNSEPFSYPGTSKTDIYLCPPSSPSCYHKAPALEGEHSNMAGSKMRRNSQHTENLIQKLFSDFHQLTAKNLLIFALARGLSWWEHRPARKVMDSIPNPRNTQGATDQCLCVSLSKISKYICTWN